MPEDIPIQPIARRQAQSGNVDWSDPIILHESRARRQVLVPFYVPRTDGTDFACKIQTYRKQAPPNDWVVVEEKSISLKEPAARTLLDALRKHLAVADHSAGGGDFMVIPIDGGVPDFGSHDPSVIAGALCSALAQPGIADHLNGANIADEIPRALRGAIRLREMQSAVAQLRVHLDSGDAAERTYQEWCERNSWAFGNAYVMRDDVREISPGDSLDLLLPTVIAGYRDIVELKRPDMDVLLWDGSHRNFYFSSDVSKAIGQCHRYLDVLHEVAANGLRDHPEIVAYHPRAILVIGRSSDWEVDKLKALHGLNARLSGITLMTYDHLLNQGERLIQSFSDAAQTSEEDDNDESDNWFLHEEDDDLEL